MRWARVHVAAGQSVVVPIEAPFSAFTLADAQGVRGGRAGLWTVRVGMQQAALQGMSHAEATL